MKQKILLALMLLTAAFSAHAYDFEVDGIYYDIYEDEAIVTGKTFPNDANEGNYYSGEIVIPETVIYDYTTYPVTAIGPYAFRYCEGVSSVTIPNSVTSYYGICIRIL